MTNIYMEAYQEYLNGNIYESELNSILDCIQESVLETAKMYKEKIKAIKKEKPSEYDGNEAVKKFVDKNYKELIECAEFLEKEPEKLRKGEIKYMITVLVSLITSYASVLLMYPFPKVGGVVSISLWILTLLLTVIYPVITYVRGSNDIKISDELMKVRSALKKVQANLKGKDPDTEKKIMDICTAIDDADTEISSRFKTTKESYDDYADYTDVKLRIFKEHAFGNISDSERNELLMLLESKR